ncbi:MAG TPA: DUF6457 domain-containing protein [Acidimicrobiales bacterium]|nr:DUF6457 domain-containing protein [Acidimicrobiales bacterium]
MTLSGSEWVERFAERLGLDPPSAEESTILLDLAGLAAHSSERTAAPISCWLAARAGITAAKALNVAEALRDEISIDGKA